MEMLSEHQCEGWLEGYLLTGRHGLFNCYEAFIHIIDSMFNQHAKWLKVTRHIPWRRPIACLNILLASHVWRQDHNGFTHQDPGFIDHVVNKKAEVIRVYLPPDTNTLLSVMDHCLRSRHYVNVIVASKHPSPQWLDMDAAIKHCTAGIGIWEWASNDKGGEPDVVMACAGDVPTLETLAAVKLLREHVPDLKIRVINVVDLMRLQPATEHPHGLDDHDFDTLFTKDKPVIFAYHGYPWLIHRLTYRRTNHQNIHVRGYKEEGTITHAVRHGRDERPGPLPPGRRRGRSRAATEHDRRLRQAGRPRQADRAPAVHHDSTARTCPRSATGAGAERGVREPGIWVTLVDCWIARASPLVQLQRQPIRVGEEGKPLARKLVHPDHLDGDPLTLEMRHGLVDVDDLEGQVSQPARLGIAQTAGRVREGEELDLRAVGNPQVQFVGIAFLAVDFRDDVEPQDLGVEPPGHLIFRADDGDVMRPQESHAQSPIQTERPDRDHGHTRKLATWPRW